MDNKAMKTRIRSISRDMEQMKQTLIDLRATDMESDPEAYQKLSAAAAVKGEIVTCRLRHFLYDFTLVSKDDYLLSAAKAQGIAITEEDGIVEIKFPALLLGRRRRMGTEYLIDPLVAAMEEFAETHPRIPYEHCAVCFCSVFSREWPERRKCDYDNPEWKAVLDVVASYLLIDDSPLLCDTYYTTELGDSDYSKVIIMDYERFPSWYEGQNRD